MLHTTGESPHLSWYNQYNSRQVHHETCLTGDSAHQAPQWLNTTIKSNMWDLPCQSMSTTVPTNFVFLRKDIISFYFKKCYLCGYVVSLLSLVLKSIHIFKNILVLTFRNLKDCCNEIGLESSYEDTHTSLRPAALFPPSLTVSSSSTQRPRISQKQKQRHDCLQESLPSQISVMPRVLTWSYCDHFCIKHK